MSPKKRTSLSVQQKLELLQKVKENNRNEICKTYGCFPSVLSRIIKEESKLRKLAAENKNTKRKRLRTGKHDNVDRAVATWFNEMRLKNASINGPMICEQAKKYAQMLDVNDFEPSTGWLDRWKRRENINFHKTQGEINSADFGSATCWLRDVLPKLIVGYSSENVYNADESGLFYRMLPNGTMAKCSERPKGIKCDKSRLTLLFLCNMTH